MALIIKLVTLLICIHFWNRIIVKNMLKWLIDFHKKYNRQNLNKQPIQFVIENEKRIYNFFAGFYWVGAITIVIVILTKAYDF